MSRSILFLQSLYRSTHMRHGLWYLGSNVLAAFVPFFLLPFLTRVLDPVAYGQYSLFTMAITAALPLVTWMFSAIIAREYGLRKPAEFASFFSLCLLLTLAFVLFWGLLAEILKHSLHQLLQLPSFWIQCALICGLAQGLSSTMQSLSAMRRQPVHYTYWRLGYALAMGAALYGGARYGNGWESIGYSQTAIALMVLLVVVVVSFRQHWLTRISFDETTRKDAALALGYSTPLVIHILTAGFLLQSVDRLFISHYLGLAEAGSYNVAQQISLTISLIISSMNQVWQPWLNERLKEGTASAKAQVVRTTYYGFIGLWVVGIAAIGAIWIIFPYLIGEEFHAARGIVPILMASGIVNGMYVLVAAPLFFYGNTVHIMGCNIGTALVTLALNAALVPHFGMVGAACATFSAMGFMFFAIWLTSMRLHSLPWLSAWKHARREKAN